MWWPKIVRVWWSTCGRTFTTALREWGWPCVSFSWRCFMSVLWIYSICMYVYIYACMHVCMLEIESEGGHVQASLRYSCTYDCMHAFLCIFWEQMMAKHELFLVAPCHIYTYTHDMCTSHTCRWLEEIQYMTEVHNWKHLYLLSGMMMCTYIHTGAASRLRLVFSWSIPLSVLSLE